MKHAYVYLLLLIYFFHISCGQKQAEPHKDNINYDIKDTVTSHGPNTSVRTIRQDRKGNIWLASNEGIIRYDGMSFTRFATKDGLINQDVWSIIRNINISL